MTLPTTSWWEQSGSSERLEEEWMLRVVRMSRQMHEVNQNKTDEVDKMNQKVDSKNAVSVMHIVSRVRNDG